MRVYLDESGDLGWKFDNPYRRGGSSRYLCLAFLFLPKAHEKEAMRLVREMYLKYEWSHEKKATNATLSLKKEFAQKTKNLLLRFPDIRVDCIVAKKENVLAHIRSDPNKLYNYMCRLVVPDYASKEPEITFIPDKRSIKVESGNSLSDYLQTYLWFECKAKTILINSPKESTYDYNLQFVDWIANGVWANFEDNQPAFYQEIASVIKLRKLYFD